MTLQEQITRDFTEALKAGDAQKRDALRLLENAVRNEAIAQKKKEEGLSDDTVIAVVQSAIKQRRESASLYKKGNRPELAEKEEYEAALFAHYMPAQMSTEDVEKIVAETRAAMDEKLQGNMGAVMGAVMQKCKGKADGAIVRLAVEKSLADGA